MATPPGGPRGRSPAAPSPDPFVPVFHSLTLLLCLAGADSGAAQLPPAVALPVLTQGTDDALTVADDGRGTPYVVNKSDNICGLDQPRQLTNPAVVDYDTLLAATPEAKKIAKDKIDPKSSQASRS